MPYMAVFWPYMVTQMPTGIFKVTTLLVLHDRKIFCFMALHGHSDAYRNLQGYNLVGLTWP